MKRSFAFIVFLVLVVACSTQRKLQSLIKGNAEQVQLKLGEEADFLPKVDTTSRISHDTLKVKDDEGNEMILMKAVKDEETGEMVAAEELAPVTVTARFRNVAERSGKVDLSFQVIVPQSMRDSRWQLRFNPVMYVLVDSVSLEPVIITGSAYRKAQMRGYQLYDKFVSRIVQDSTKFINVRQLDIFLRRYIPSVYSYKSDTSYVSEKEFYSAYGLSERQAVEHYTNKYAKAANERRKARQEKMYHKYVKVPIVTELFSLSKNHASSSSNGVFGFDFYGSASPSSDRPKVFFPAAGQYTMGNVVDKGSRGYYWSSDEVADSSPSCAYGLTLSNGGSVGSLVANVDTKNSVRCVKGEVKPGGPEPTVGPNDYVDAIAKNWGESVKIGDLYWAPVNCGATESNLYGEYYSYKSSETACPSGWRLPTNSELSSLSEHYSSMVTYRGMKGRWFSGASAYCSSGVPKVFFPAAGCSGRDKDEGGEYCSSPTYNDPTWYFEFRVFLKFDDKSVSDNQILYSSKETYSVRCVKK